MCGINGLISLQSESEDQLRTYINQMNNLIIHRGPDDDGVFVESSDGISIAMGMRRLSIIDLSSGKQPIYSKDGKLVIVLMEKYIIIKH